MPRSGAPSAARAMSEHLLQQTLSPEMAAMAEYYHQGLSPPTPAEAAAARYAEIGRPVGGARHERAPAAADAFARDGGDGGVLPPGLEPADAGGSRRGTLCRDRAPRRRRAP